MISKETRFLKRFPFFFGCNCFQTLHIVDLCSRLLLVASKPILSPVKSQLFTNAKSSGFAMAGGIDFVTGCPNENAIPRQKLTTKRQKADLRQPASDNGKRQRGNKTTTSNREAHQSTAARLSTAPPSTSSRATFHQPLRLLNLQQQAPPAVATAAATAVTHSNLQQNKL